MIPAFALKTVSSHQPELSASLALSTTVPQPTNHSAFVAAILLRDRDQVVATKLIATFFAMTVCDAQFTRSDLPMTMASKDGQRRERRMLDG